MAFLLKRAACSSKSCRWYEAYAHRLKKHADSTSAPMRNSRQPEGTEAGGITTGTGLRLATGLRYRVPSRRTTAR